LNSITDQPEGLRILVLAEDVLARTNLGILVAGMAHCRHVGGAALVDLAAAVDAYAPDAILMDLGGGDSGELAEFRLSDADPPLVALVPDQTAGEQDRRAGALGVLARSARPERIRAALHAAALGLAVIEPDLQVGPPPARRSNGEWPVEPLTRREMDVLRLLVEGLTNRGIAARLAISEFTVKFHVNSILTKLNAQSRTEAVGRAARLGLIKL
jgi:DNA-binding NarL/FixJ family response regulator